MDQPIHSNLFDIVQVLQSRRAQSVLGPENICFCKITTRKKLISEETRVFSYRFLGVDTYLESLCVFANKLIDKSNVPNRIRSECIFLVRNIYTDEDIKVTICIPGTLDVSCYDSKLVQRPIVSKVALQQGYVSSVLRYMLSVFVPSKGIYEDPFGSGYSAFKEFMDSVIEQQKTHKTKWGAHLNYQEISQAMGDNFHLVSLFANRMKLHLWLETYSVQRRSLVESSQILIHFFCEVFAFSSDPSRLKLILAGQHFNPLWTYYLSLISNKDQQVQILKKLTYLNKTQIWLLLADIYINQHITNFTLASKGLQILNILSERKDNTIKLPNPFRSKLSTEAVLLPESEVYSLPVIPMNYGVKIKTKLQTSSIELQCQSLRGEIVKYFNFSPLQRTIVRKLAFLIGEIGSDKTQQLFPRVFEQQFAHFDPISYTPQSQTPLRGRKQSVELDVFYEIPSFAQHKPTIEPVLSISIPTLTSTSESTKPQLWPIVQEDVTHRQQNSISPVRLDPVQYCSKKYSSSKFIQLLEVALDTHSYFQKILLKLGIKPTQLGTLTEIKLCCDDLLVMAEVAEIFSMHKLAAVLYNAVRIRILDLYSVSKLAKLTGRLGEYNSQLLVFNQFIVDVEKYGNTKMSQLPLWLQEVLVGTLRKKGKVFVEALLKSNSIVQESITGSINKYGFVNIK